VKSVVIITTDKVYENKEWVYPYRETDSLGGYDPYSASKAAADILTSSYIQSFFNPKDFGTKHHTLVAIARAGNVIGGGDWAPFRLVPDIMRSVFDAKQDIVIRSPHAIRPWEHVLEPLSGYLLLGQKLYAGDTSVSSVWNFGPDEYGFVTVEKVVRDTLAILEAGRVQVEPDTSKHEATLLKLDINKARTYLGWTPTLSYSENIRLTAEWYKAYYGQKTDMLTYTQSQIKEFFNI
jgi:CDP-glucose 4,6-dehydratase